jgi:glucose/arabinose dehydrogenase
MRKLSATALPLILLACSGGAPAESQPADKPFKTSVIADFDSPWAMTFLPDGRMLVTEKAGEMLLFDPKNGTKIPVAGIPKVDSEGQGALMDIVLAPQFGRNGIVYFSFSEAGAGGKGVALATGKFDQASDGTTKLDGVKVIFRGDPKVEGNGHYSGRIAFSPDGRYLFFTNGERQKFDPAQDPKSTLGKVLRLNLDGTPARGNPLSSKGFNPAIWSYGHRNLLGIAFDGDGHLWEQEMGPEGGDEINLIKPGLNYGWPKASNGTHYDGRDIPDHKTGDGFEAPKVWWNPSISPAGLVYYTGALFPQWKGSLFLGGLSSQALIRVKIDGETASKADQWDMGARIREVEQGPDGALWILEDGAKGSQGRLLKLTPAS